MLNATAPPISFALFVVWFASGIVMMYTRGMPALSIEQSLELKSAIPTEEIGITPI